MNVAGTELNENANVVSLFSGLQIERRETNEVDPLQELLREAEAEAWEEVAVPVIRAERILVNENQFPDQSIYLLEKQLSQLTESMARLKFYLSDLDDLLPR